MNERVLVDPEEAIPLLNALEFMRSQAGTYAF